MKQPQIPVKMLTITILMVFLCVGSYLLSPKWQAVRAEYQRQRDPLHQFASQQTPEAQLQSLQDKIRANPQNSEQWALLGEYYLWQNDYSNSLLAYRQALQLRGENAELYAALATVLYYQASQHMTAQTRYWASIICGKTITAIRCWRTVRRCNYVVRTLNCMRRWRRCFITRPANI